MMRDRILNLGSAACHHCCSSPFPALATSRLWARHSPRTPAVQPVCLGPISQLALRFTAPLPGSDLILHLHQVHGVGFNAIQPDVLPATRLRGKEPWASRSTYLAACWLHWPLCVSSPSLPSQPSGKARNR